MARVTLDDLTVSIERTRVLDGIAVDIADGAFVALLGPSGVGKSTLLRAIAGLVTSERGTVRFDGADVTDEDTSARDVGMVFQTPALLPKRNVRRNVEFPLEIRHETAASIRDRVNAEVRSLHIEHLLTRHPSELSRGEEQLVQIARTMVRSPRLLLLDEPFAPLDENRRHQMRAEMRLLQQGYGVTTIMATNDPLDAASLASMVVVFGGEPATVVQVGSFTEVHDHPHDLNAAVATGSLWTTSVDVESDGHGYWLTRDRAVRLRAWSPALDTHVGSTVVLGVRTEGLVRDAQGEATAELDRIVPGHGSQLVCRWGDRLVHAVGEAEPSDVGTRIRLRLDNPLVFDRVSGRRIA